MKRQRRDNMNKIDRTVLDELAKPAACPDLTRSIMGRLGYMQVDPAVARRHRMKRWAARSAVLMMMLAIVVSGIAVFNQSDRVRRPHDMTIPAAISHDVAQHQQRFHSLIHILQTTGPGPRNVPGNVPGSVPQHTLPHPAIAVPVSHDRHEPFSADRFDGGEMDHDDAGHNNGDRMDDGAGERLDDEVDRSAVAPVRWV